MPELLLKGEVRIFGRSADSPVHIFGKTVRDLLSIARLKIGPLWGSKKTRSPPKKAPIMNWDRDSVNKFHPDSNVLGSATKPTGSTSHCSFFFNSSPHEKSMETPQKEHPNSCPVSILSMFHRTFLHPFNFLSLVPHFQLLHSVAECMQSNTDGFQQ